LRAKLCLARKRFLGLERFDLAATKAEFRRAPLIQPCGLASVWEMLAHAWCWCGDPAAGAGLVKLEAMY
jgi:hypothetical protein